jgi:hypothetical protein
MLQDASWIHLAQNRAQWWDVVERTINLLVPLKGKALMDQLTITFHKGVSKIKFTENYIYI